VRAACHRADQHIPRLVARLPLATSGAVSYAGE
jgi:hypothetical protein